MRRMGFAAALLTVFAVTLPVAMHTPAADASSDVAVTATATTTTTTSTTTASATATTTRTTTPKTTTAPNTSTSSKTTTTTKTSATKTATSSKTTSTSTATTISTTRPVTVTPDPLAARPFYVDPRTWAAWGVKYVPSTAADVGVIARTPQAKWFTDSTPITGIAAEVRTYVNAATQLGQMPVLVIYAIPFRDCGGYSAGGLDSAADYSSWVGQVVAGIAGRSVGVVLEPDALVNEDCLSTSARALRTSMLADAVTQLSKNSHGAVYIDGGHSRWLTPAQLADRLRAVGISKVRGFSLNVSNFFTTAEQVAYGEKVSALLGGKHYVVDTSRNGNGPAPDAPLNWCNPAGRALGTAPTAKTAGAHADAYLWIKHPGESDGECGRGDPPSGTWFNSYAVGLVRAARTIGVQPN